MEPILRAGETFLLPREMSREELLKYWFRADRETFVAESNGTVVGTHYLRSNLPGGGAHVANCGYATATDARGRGVAGAMCDHSLNRARARGFRAMQFNSVVSTNTGAVRLWTRHGFEIVGRLPAAFAHPTAGYVDLYVMFRGL